MKTIEVDDELYRYIAAHTLHIGESASDILRRMLKFTAASQPAVAAAPVVKAETVAAPAPAAAPVAEVKTVKSAKDKVRAMRELLLSRELRDIARSQNAAVVLVGTYSPATDYTYVSVKLVRTEDSRILRGHDYALPNDRDVQRLLQEPVFR